ncbi:hypothetical protein C2G38_2176455 [Gigaspora rosea]|uniref:Sel1 repeat-containing protein n=1 Tax=Gigaspora rosea TaxID=44941 RepID=A0A397VNN4_9GLOM|nr:hypothetical protein C2G38_2176455 [Gigaspora rosea]
MSRSNKFGQKEVCPGKSCLSTVTRALGSYYILELSKKNDGPNLITKSSEPKGTEFEIGYFLKENKKNEHKVSIYHEKLVEPNQYGTCTLGIDKQNNYEAESPVNNPNNQLSEFNRDYLAEPFAEIEKEDIQELLNVSSIKKDIFPYCQKLTKTETADRTYTIGPIAKKKIEFKLLKMKEFINKASKMELNNADKIIINNKNPKAAEVDIESQVLSYAQRSIKVKETELIEVKDCGKQKLIRKRKSKIKKNLEESDHKNFVEEWNKSGDEFRITVSKAKTSIQTKSAKNPLSDEDIMLDKNKAFNYQKTADIGNINGMYSFEYCYQNGFGIEKDEHKAFEYYKKSTDTGSTNRAYMVRSHIEESIARIRKDDNKNERRKNNDIIQNSNSSSAEMEKDLLLRDFTGAQSQEEAYVMD